MKLTFTRVAAIEGMAMKIVVATSELRCTYDIKNDVLTVETTKQVTTAEMDAAQEAINTIMKALGYP